MAQDICTVMYFIIVRIQLGGFLFVLCMIDDLDFFCIQVLISICKHMTSTSTFNSVFFCEVFFIVFV